MTEAQLDHELSKQLASLVEKLTTTGAVVLNAQLLKEFKKICKTSDLYVERAYHLLMAQLNKEHAEIRLSTFQVIDEIFNRSHAFRELLVSDFQNFLELTVETDQHHRPLPPPKAAANKLKADTLRTVQQWQDKYASAYRKLALGYKYLKTCKHVNFSDIRAQSLAEQRRQEQQEQRKQRALAAKLEKVRKEFSELQKEITDTATEAENCIELLLPKPDQLFTEIDFGGGDSVGNSSANKASASQYTADASAGSFPSGTGDGDFSESISNESSNRVSDKTDTQPNSSEAPSQPKRDCEKSAGSADQQGHKSERTGSSHSAASDDPCPNGAGQSDESDDDDDDFEDVDEDEAVELGIVQTHGMGSRKYNLQIEIGPDQVCLTETEDNRDLFRSLKDSSCLVSTRYLPQVVRWLEVLSKTGGSQSEIKAMIDLKQRLETIKSKCAELRVVPDPSAQHQQSDSDEEMEEVPEKEGYEPVIPAHLRTEYGLAPNPESFKQPAPASQKKTPSTRRESSQSEQQDSAETAAPSGSGKKRTLTSWSLNEQSRGGSVHDPTSRVANIVRLGLEEEDARPSTSKEKPATVTSEGRNGIPVLPYGPDLTFWGSPEKIEVPTVVKNDSLHRFWVPAEVEHEKPSQSDIAAVMNRTFHYTGEFVPVKWKCRVKLPNGKLCERMDRVKCPFHGKIVPRDEEGSPSNPADVKKEPEETGPRIKDEPRDEERQEVKPWLDAELQADIEAATGHDLGSQRSRAKDGKAKGSKGKGKGKKKKDEGLTNIKESRNTTRARLEAKVFNKRALKRVGSALDAADYKRVRDKFGNQFNYSIN